MIKRSASKYIVLGILAAVFASILIAIPTGIVANAAAQDVATKSGTASPSRSDWDAYTPKSRTISVTGSAVTKVSPDTVTISFGIENQNNTARLAAQTNAAVAAKVITAMKDSGVLASEIGTSYYNIYPVYETRDEQAKCSTSSDGKTYCPPPTGKQILVGYKALNSIIVQSSKLEKSGDWIDAAIDAGANRVDSVSFSASQSLQNKIRTQLVSEAIADAQNQANVALTSLGRNVTDILNVNLSNYPVIYAKRGFENSGASPAAAPTTPIIPESQEVMLTAQVTFEIGETSQARQLAVQAANSTSITASATQNFNITLDSNPTTGYQWDVAVNTNSNTAKFVSSEFLASQSDLLGAGGKQVLTFQALSAGKATIVLEYARPWDRENPIEVHLIYLTVT